MAANMSSTAPWPLARFPEIGLRMPTRMRSKPIAPPRGYEITNPTPEEFTSGLCVSGLTIRRAGSTMLQMTWKRYTPVGFPLTGEEPRAEAACTRHETTSRDGIAKRGMAMLDLAGYSDATIAGLVERSPG